MIEILLMVTVMIVMMVHVTPGNDDDNHVEILVMVKVMFVMMVIPGNDDDDHDSDDSL